MTTTTYTEQRRALTEQRAAAQAQLAALEGQRKAIVTDSFRDADLLPRVNYVEQQIAALHVALERLDLALVEGDRREAEAERQRQEAAKAELAVQHARLSQDREAAFAAVEAHTKALVEVIHQATAVDRGVWNTALQLGWPPETRTVYRISDYIGSQLNLAGFKEFPLGRGTNRGPLSKQSKE